VCNFVGMLALFDTNSFPICLCLKHCFYVHSAVSDWDILLLNYA